MGQWEASEKSGLVPFHTCSLGATVYLLCPHVRPCKVGGHYGLHLLAASSTGPHWLDSPSNSQDQHLPSIPMPTNADSPQYHRKARERAPCEPVAKSGSLLEGGSGQKCQTGSLG